MRRILVNEADHPFGDRAAEIEARGWRVVNAPRPLPGNLQWQGDFRAGIFYAAGDVDECGAEWEALDAALIDLVTDEQIETMLRANLAEADLDMTFEEAVQMYGTLVDLAAMYNLPYRGGRGNA
jgi:hypothetical protein